ncbi:MAG: alpha-galactosidase [Candidatus Lokiarchaeota archaeon]
MKSDDIQEFRSTFLHFQSEVFEIEDNIGSGFRIIFTPQVKKDSLFKFKILFVLYEKTDYILVKLTDIENISKKSFKIHSISPITIRNSNLWLSGSLERATNLNNISWFKNGWQSWSPCKTYFGNEKDREGPPLKIFKRTLDNQDYEIKGKFYSEYCTTITDLSSKISLILGFTTLKDQFSRFVFDFKNKSKIKFLTAIGCMDGVKLSECSIDYSEELFIGFKSKSLGYYGLIEYATIVEEYVKDYERISEVPIGWCSWYYYFTEVTQNNMIKNLNFFKINEENLPIDYIQLDDGYFREIGDYKKVNQKFSDGLPSLFKKIHNAGFEGGIWTAPFIANKNSDFFQNNKELFLKKQGKNKFLKANFNWGKFQYGLDLTQQATLTYIKRFFDKLRYAFDQELEDEIIEFYKIDFLHAAAPYDAEYENKSLTRAQLYRNGIEAIREGIGESSFLLGCGAPLGPCVGLVDAMRISMDTAPKWKNIDWLGDKFGFSLSNLKRALINILYRSFMHRHFWINDPDCLMLRRTDTNLKYNEIKLQLTIFGLSGGQILISDDMTKLSRKELEDAKLVIPPYNPEGYEPIVTDALVSKIPSIYFLETEEFIGKRYLTAIINWDDNFKERKILIEDIIPNLSQAEDLFYLFDFWEEFFLGTYNRTEIINLKISPHSCAYLSIIPIEEEDLFEPVFLSSTLHITQGCYEITDFEYNEEEKIILIIIDLIGERSGSIFLKLPTKEKISECKFPYELIDRENDIWKIQVEFQDSISLDIKL